MKASPKKFARGSNTRACRERVSCQLVDQGVNEDSEPSEPAGSPIERLSQKRIQIAIEGCH